MNHPSDQNTPQQPNGLTTGLPNDGQTFYLGVEPLPPAPPAALSSAPVPAPAPLPISAPAPALAPVTVPTFGATEPQVGYSPVAPAPVPPAPVAPAPVPPAPVAPALVASETVPEWDQHVPPPAIATAVPDVVVDARSFREVQAQPTTPPQNHFNPPPVAAPPIAQPAVPQQTAQARPHYSQQAPLTQVPITTNYSPFRDDPNSYSLVIEHRGIQYYTTALSEQAKAYINSFGRRFVADPAHQIVEAVENVILPRSIALEEVCGGTIDYFGESTVLAPGHIYNIYPELEGRLFIRPLTLEEVNNPRWIATTHPGTYEKMMKAQEADYDIVLASVLLGWTIPRAEVNSTNIKRLTLEVKRVIFTRLGAGAVLGLNEDDFFHRRN